MYSTSIYANPAICLTVIIAPTFVVSYAELTHKWQTYCIIYDLETI